jgi:hypothetical protein
MQRSSSRPPWKIDIYMHVVYIALCDQCMNYDCTTHPILPFIKITTKFLSKHYTEMNVYHCFNFTEKLSYDVFHFEASPRGGA